MLNQKVYADNNKGKQIKLRMARADIFIDVDKEILVAAEEVKLSNFYLTTKNKNSLSRKYLGSDGKVNKQEMAKLLEMVRLEFGTERPFSSHFSELNSSNNELYPDPNTILNWHKLSSWSDLLTQYDYPAKEKNKYYPEKFFEECLKLAGLLIEDKPNFSKIDYDTLNVSYLEVLEEQQILAVMSKQNLDFLRKRGRFPTSSTVAKYFGGWNSAKNSAKVAVSRESLRWEATQENLLSALLTITKRLQALPSQQDIENSKELPSINTFGDVFETKTWPVILFYLVKELKNQGRDELIEFSRLGAATKKTLLHILEEAGLSAKAS